jgi:hypothetical protein
VLRFTRMHRINHSNFFLSYCGLLSWRVDFIYILVITTKDESELSLRGCPRHARIRIHSVHVNEPIFDCFITKQFEELILIPFVAAGMLFLRLQTLDFVSQAIKFLWKVNYFLRIYSVFDCNAVQSLQLLKFVINVLRARRLLLHVWLMWDAPQ